MLSGRLAIARYESYLTVTIAPKTCWCHTWNASPVLTIKRKYSHIFDLKKFETYILYVFNITRRTAINFSIFALHVMWYSQRPFADFLKQKLRSFFFTKNELQDDILDQRIKFMYLTMLSWFYLFLHKKILFLYLMLDSFKPISRCFKWLTDILQPTVNSFVSDK